MHTQFNKDISDYKSNFWKGLTFRQTVFGGLSLFTFVAFRVILTIWFEGPLLNVFGFGGAAIFAFLGFFKKDRLPAEEVSLLFLRYSKTPKTLNCANKTIDIIPAAPQAEPAVPDAETTQVSDKEEA